MDFVGPLPTSNNRDGNFDSITVVICLLIAMVELIPSRINYKAPELAELMFTNITDYPRTSLVIKVYYLLVHFGDIYIY